MEYINLSELIDTVYNCKPNERFCFILGAGASVSSGIPTGAQMATKWLKELEDFGHEKTEDWLDALKEEGKNIAENPGIYYSELYDRRFENPLDGYLRLQKEMESITPSIGYYYLSCILANTKNNLVITTNFDSLTEDAVYTFTGRKALTITHEALAKYIFIKSGKRTKIPDRPIVAKIHRDLFLQPKSKAEDIKELSEEWKNVLKEIMDICTPIIIGYGGNDGSLMGFLESLDDNKKIYWCCISNPNDRIHNLLEKYDGYLVHIEDFDKTMYSFGVKFKYKFSEEKLKNDIEKRVQKYNIQIESLDPERNIEEAKQYFQNGKTHHLNKKYFEAIIDYTKAIYLNPGNDAYYNGRGVAYYNLEEYDTALIDFTKAIELASDNAKYYYDRGNTNKYLKKNKEAESDFAKAKELGYTPT